MYHVEISDNPESVDPLSKLGQYLLHVTFFLQTLSLTCYDGRGYLIAIQKRSFLVRISYQHTDTTSSQIHSYADLVKANDLEDNNAWTNISSLSRYWSYIGYSVRPCR